MTEILRLRPEAVIAGIHAGTIKVVAQPISPEQPKVEPTKPGAAEKAKRLFGENFLDKDAIHTMEAKFKAVGIEVKFEIPNTTFFYSEVDIERARQDESSGKGRLIVLRPETMVVREGGKEVKKTVTINNLRALVNDKNPFGSGKIFYDQNWYNNEGFANQPLKGSYAMPTREVLDASKSKNWDEQQTLLEVGERRREANEVVWDMLLYYASTGKKVLESNYDWTQTRTSDGRLVDVGYFDSNGLSLSLWLPSDSVGRLGVCPSR